MFEYLVVGKGLFGAAAGRHLSRAARNVAILGPDEPARWETHAGVYASHYDQGRIASAKGSDPLWNALDRLSMDQYGAIEEASGVPFHVPCGLIRACRQAPAHELSERKSYRSDDTLLALAPEVALERYRLRFPRGYDILLEPAPAGYINPREMIQAQLALAEASGAVVIRETAVALEHNADHVTVRTREGRCYTSRRVLLATGAYANSFDLLRRKLALEVKSETVILARLPESEARQLRGMPAVAYEVDSPVLEGLYLLPPIAYPDGYHHLKMGCNTAADRFLTDFEQMRRWMAEGDSDTFKESMRNAVLAIVPGLVATEWRTKRCLVTYTPHRKPFIDAVEPGRVYVAVGGNGKGAHPSDAIGRLAADLMLHDEWPSELEQERFRVAFAGS